MKKVTLMLLSFMMALALLLAPVSSVSAISIPTHTETLPNPTVTPVSGVASFVVQVVPSVDLPGITSLADGMLVPAGFPAGEKQFEGSGVTVTGFDYGQANACFAFTGSSEGWGGQVASWNGSKWVLLPTTFTTPSEQPYSLACASIYGSGTYTFIKWVTDPAKLPLTGSCGYKIASILLVAYSSDMINDLIIESPEDLNGKRVTVTLKGTNPPHLLTIDGAMSGTLKFLFPRGSGTYVYDLNLVTPVHYTILTTDFYTTSFSFFFPTNFGSCIQDVSGDFRIILP